MSTSGKQAVEDARVPFDVKGGESESIGGQPCFITVLQRTGRLQGKQSKIRMRASIRTVKAYTSLCQMPF